MPTRGDAEERAVLAVMIETSASGQRKFRRHGDVVLPEYAWHYEVIVELRHLARRIGVTLDGESGDPGLSARGSTDGCLAKGRVVPIPLEDFAELVIVALSSNRRTRGNDVSRAKEREKNVTASVAPPVDRLSRNSSVGSAHLVQHHDNVTGRHEHLLFDFLPREDLDAHGLILETLVGPSRCDDGDAFLKVRLLLQLHDDVLRHPGADLHGCGHGQEPWLHDGDVDVPGADDDGPRTGRVGVMAGASHDHLRVLDRFLRRPDLNTNGTRLALAGHRELTTNKYSQRE